MHSCDSPAILWGDSLGILAPEILLGDSAVGQSRDCRVGYSRVVRHSRKKSGNALHVGAPGIFWGYSRVGESEDGRGVDWARRSEGGNKMQTVLNYQDLTRPRG